MVYDSLKLFQSNDNTYFRVENSISTAYLRAKLCISPEHNEMGVIHGYIDCRNGSVVFGCRPQPILRKIEHLPSRFSLNIAPGLRAPFKCRDRCPWRAQGFPRRLSASGHIFHRKNYLILPGNLFLPKPMKTKSPKIVAELSPFLFSTPRSPFSSGSHHYLPG